MQPLQSLGSITRTFGLRGLITISFLIALCFGTFSYTNNAPE